jgi:hypothetical protein
MTTRRTIVWLISIAFGIGATLGTMALFGAGFDQFWTGFLFKGDLLLLLLPGYGSLAFIWLDFIFRTDYLKS